MKPGQSALLVHDGSEIPIEQNAAAILGEDGALQGVALVFRDARNQRRAEETSRLLAFIV
jgi:hypothetical protein